MSSENRGRGPASRPTAAQKPASRGVGTGTPEKYQSRIGIDYSIEYPESFARAAAAAGAVPLLSVRDLGVAYTTRSGEPSAAIRDVDLDIHAGSMTAVVGESGSGKSTTAGAVIGLLASNAQVTSGEIRLSAHGDDPELDLRALSPREWQKVRGARIGYIPQDPGTSLNPLKTVGANVAESLRLHTGLGSAQRRARVLELLDRVGIDRPQMRAEQYPHELSGGMRQRALIAAAISLDPQLLIADEPTSALDVTVQKRILDLLDELRREAGTGILFITHDLAVAAERADDLVVVRDGIVEEQGPARRLLGRPESEYTRRLLADAPSMQTLVGAVAAPASSSEYNPDHSGTDRAALHSLDEENAPAEAGVGSEESRTTAEAGAGSTERVASAGSGTPASAAPLVEVRGLTQVFARVPRDEDDADTTSTTAAPASPVTDDTAIIGIEDVSFTVPEGTTLGLVGESGSGKSTIGRALAGFSTPQSGSIRVGHYEAESLSKRQLREFRRTVQLVHQNPASALDPVHSVGASIAEPLRNFRIGSKADRADRVAQAMERVALEPGLASRRPRELSGGQLQRVAIARALVIEPRLVVFDEAVSALDVTVQSQILDLIQRLQEELGLTYVFISHDLAVVRQVAHTVTVLSRGHQVETGPVEQVFARPEDPYTQQLLAAIPRPLDTQVLDLQALSI
ncbi:dipeptide ABC transporter ATP-binding protein [Brevibacterium yomogidense]|uniref:Dipeptide transport ATP-binding protein DppD (TC 3.A.1.5.2) n=1 Tax=Brevibacterium yomogidense TaxID=946573 RepID=A0A1X6WUV9_9MICO|nr:ABC transporter ATP-binding protein [Brevibacterium yomogidense]SLM89130.1 Dipeptide transport ATP-binding protein DppD (TC 3.A.1.5.2) [Brevibacterium yomogidense]